MTVAQPLLLDCTRMVAHRWSRRMPTGIDRVCEAYLAHFGPQAQAVVQLRGRARVLTPSQSQALLAMLDGPRSAFRRRFAGLAAMLGTGARGRTDVTDAIYLNVSHTDFDLDSHRDWLSNTRVRPVYLLHDLIPIEHPHFTTPHKTNRHAGRVRRALDAASGIIANSHTTADAIAAFAMSEGITPPPILGAPLGAPDLPVPAARSTVQRQASFVCISTIEHRKNHMLLLDVWKRLFAKMGEAAPRLALIGRWGVGAEAVRSRYLADPQLQRFVSINSDCTDSELVGHLRSASALLAPSRAEGFGLPVVEALTLGVPVIASDLPAFREVGGSIPTFLDPSAPEAWLERIREFASNGPERQRQLAALRSYRAPRWRDHFGLVEDWLASLPEGSGAAVHVHHRSAGMAMPSALAGAAS
ncbi:MAG: glycosyltransferase family 1 protein [Erythrobacter sp.]|jgi:glycosyltransferase involved in cell wall biosynthesis|nr:glycosyltransferase family 1 protein [Erythrobacter sp.]